MTDNLSEQMDNLSPEKRALLALRLKKKRQADSPKQGIPRALREGQNNLFPLSFAQQRLWFMDQLEPGNASYNGAMAIRIKGTLNSVAMEQSFNEIARRHEALRTIFTVAEDGQPMQKILSALSIPLPIVDLRQHPADMRETRAQEQCTAEAQKSFDLTRGPLIRITLLQLSETEHILLMVVHHIIADLWSVGIIIKDLAVLYGAFCAENRSPLPELPIQYVDFAIWQRDWLRGETLEKQLAYWKKQLENSPSMLELPTDHPRPATLSYVGNTQSFILPADLFKKLKTLSQEQGVTLFMLLLAAFKVLLMRYSGQTDIIIGSPIANRNRYETEEMVGFFVNTLVLRTDLAGKPGFIELLRRVREVCFGAYAHQDLPFEKLVQELHLERDISRNPLFQVMFVLQTDVSAESMKLPGLSVSDVAMENHTAKFDLKLSMAEEQGLLIGYLEYSSDIFEPATIRQISQHFQVLLEGIVADPQQSIVSLPLLTPTERQKMLIEWNDTKKSFMRETCFHTLFEAQVEKKPDAVALVFENQQLSYRQLNEQANQLAHALRKTGVGPDVLVGICMERSLEMVIALLGILKAGGAYVPLDPNLPVERLNYMLQNVSVSVLLTQQNLQTNLQVDKTICMESDGQAFRHEPTHNLSNKTSPNNLAYVIYTSGSTGRPKGVGIEHRQLCNYLQGILIRLMPPVNASFAMISPFNTDLGHTMIFPALAGGGALHVISQKRVADPQALAEYFDQHLIDYLKIVPSHLAALTTSNAKRVLPRRCLVLGGEASRADWIASLLRQAPDCQILNHYGPTETTVGVITYSVVPENLEKTITLPTGRPLANTQTYLLDESLEPVAIGVIGHLHIGGAGVTRGYLRQPDLTAEKFIPDPFGAEPGGRLYKTGDLARYLPDGNIQFLGRVDHQIKIRGFRVEPGEIEVALTRHPEIRESIVMAREDASGGKRLVAYVVSQQKLDPTALRAFLKQQGLPEYILPAAYVFLENLPLMANGKVDRKALPAPSGERPDLEGTYLPPQTLVEKMLADIWTQVLMVERVGINDNFFELGGDSILSIQIISKANQMGYALTAKQIFQYQTIAELAVVAQAATAIKAEQGLVRGPGLLTPIQHRFFERNLASPHFYNQALSLEVTESIDFSLLEQAVQYLLQHHDALRQRFAPNDQGGWLSTYAELDESSTSCLLIDLSASPLPEQNHSIEATAAAMQTNLNLSTGPLMRVILFKLGPDRPNRLLWICHHLLVDGVSWRILLEDFQTIYAQLKLKQTVVLPAKTTSYKDWAQSLTAYACSTSFQTELLYWMKKHRVTALPVDLPIAPEKNIAASAKSVTVSFSIPETQSLLQEIPRAYGVQINDVLLMALGYALTKWTNTETCLIDLEGHGREEMIEGVDLSRTVGWFTSTFPLFIDLHGASDLRQVLQLVKKQLQDLPSRGVGYGILRYLSADKGVGRSLQQLPQPEIGFNYLGQLDQALPADSLFRMTSERSGAVSGGAVFGDSHERRQHLIDINGAVSNGQMRIEWTYSTSIHQHETIEHLAAHYKEALQWLITHKDSPENKENLRPDPFDVDLSSDELDNILNEIDFS